MGFNLIHFCYTFTGEEINDGLATITTNFDNGSVELGIIHDNTTIHMKVLLPKLQYSLEIESFAQARDNCDAFASITLQYINMNYTFLH